MAKNGNGKWVVIAITLILLIGTVVADFVWGKANVKAVSLKTDNLKQEGCDPSKRHELSYVAMQKDIENIDERHNEQVIRQDRRDEKNDERFEKILEKLSK